MMPTTPARLGPAAALLMLAACVAPKAATGPAERVAAAPPVIALPPPAPVGDWRDVPLTPGTWRYRAEAATAEYGAGAPQFVVACDRGTRTVSLYRPGQAIAAVPARLTTSSAVRSFATGAVAGGVGWRLAARDPVLDQIAFSRGRFVVEGDGLPRLVLPAWAEVSRVIEECRA